MTDFPQLNLSQKDVSAVLKTSYGDISLALFPEQAPKAVENFLTHAKQGDYDQVIFHRVINDFMVQTGDPDGTGRGGQSIWGKPFEDEFSDELFNIRGALSMANAGPNTNGSQFFIVQNKHFPKQMKPYLGRYPQAIAKVYQEEGGTPWLDGKHTVFGQVVEGMDVLDKIAAAKVNRADQPLKDIVIEKVIL